MHKLFEIPSITLFLCVFCAFLWLKNLFNQRNPRLMNYFCASGTISTFVERSLQIRLFMQNEPNFRKSQMNVTDLPTMNYEKMDTWWCEKNKPNSNPIQTQFLSAISVAGQRQKNAAIHLFCCWIS